ncbi:hypothetical protein BOSEA31B_12942 [Hyphomicrobiales bacterium]|nr:hypothetical protein BOSEA31B_12942 [Hyphomicrobiales bacterium]CAH1698715.1 hypothetical protein BOSEA1005_11768 [Hyphomicrobiales bacterium]CAI0342362.1 hypothetical protein BO1005MUT1_180141 [Hyphomicrobiales bacterium]
MKKQNDGTREVCVTLDAKFVERARGILDGKPLDAAFLMTLMHTGLEYEEAMERAGRIWDQWDEFKIPDRHEDDDEIPF